MGPNNRHKCEEFILNSNNRDWSKVKIVAFDSPQVTDMPYTERLRTLQNGISPTHNLLSVVSPLTCQSRQHLDSFHQQVTERGGEGVILRKPGAWYFAKDSFMKKEV
jgi:DNA ligase-1